MSDDIERYLKARQAVQVTTDKVNHLVGQLTRVTDSLTKGEWRRAAIIIPPYSPPPEAYQGGNRIQKENWPTMDQIVEALCAWKTARDEQDKAWKDIPASSHPHLQQPLP